ncbi:MAG: dienelactone hydrolase family protein [Novosphingobium sp.]
MCDEFTAADENALLSRRQFGMIGAGAAVVAGFPGVAACAAEKHPATPLSEAIVSITTPDGMADALFVHPASGKHPGVIMWPDIGGLRDAYKQMARRLAADGFAVLVVNQYYRSAKSPVLATFAEWRTPEGQAKITPMRAQLTSDAIARDAKAFVAFLDGQAAVDTARGIGSAGYCMGGPFTVLTAAAVPDRVRAAASFHGAALVTDQADSPHKLIASTKASFLFAIAKGDDARAPGDKDALRAAAAAAGRPAEIEVYPAEHGWCALDAPVYDQVQADRAWARMLALFNAL